MRKYPLSKCPTAVTTDQISTDPPVGASVLNLTNASHAKFPVLKIFPPKMAQWMLGVLDLAETKRFEMELKPAE